MPNITKYETNNGRSIYQIPIQPFPRLAGQIYLIDNDDQLLLIDTGSGTEECNNQIVAGLAAIQEQFNLPATLADIHQIIITHAHIDHFGGLPFIKSQTKAKVAVHALDAPILTHFPDALKQRGVRLEQFLHHADVTSNLHANLMVMHYYLNEMYQSTAVDQILQDQDTFAGINIYHTPGHCDGLICLQVDDILLTADHILNHITPHQLPQALSPFTGLNHYFQSLDKIAQLPNLTIGLAGHEPMIDNLYQRITEIKQFHQDRLAQTVELCHQPQTISSVSQQLFGQVKQFTIMLALEEAGAHVEYLHQQGELTLYNEEECRNDPHTPALYQRA